MSFTENDRNFRSDLGRTFPVAGTSTLDSVAFQAAIAAALRRDFGGATAAVKTLARATGANARTVRNWLEARNGPSGHHLVMLMHHSPAVVEAVLRMAGQTELLQVKLVVGLRERIRDVLSQLESLSAS
jgi:hypothetical protein